MPVKILRSATIFGFFFALLVVVLVLVSPLWWGFALFEHFRIYAGWGAIAVMLLGLFFGFRFRAVLMAAAAAFFLYPLWPYYFAPADEPVTSDDRTYRAMLANVLHSNGDKGAVLDAVRSKDPDVLLLMEITSDWVTALKPLEEDYPHRILEAREGPFGMWLLSKFPLAGVEIIQNGEGRHPAIAADIIFGDREMHFVGVHPPPPVGSRAAEDHAIQVSDFGHRMVVVRKPRMLMGDLNATPWSSAFRHIKAVTGLRDSAVGRGVEATWGHGNFPFLPLPLDHCLVSEEIKVIEREVTRSIGSDHRGVVVEFALPRPDDGLQLPGAEPSRVEAGGSDEDRLERAVISEPGVPGD